MYFNEKQIVEKLTEEGMDEDIALRYAQAFENLPEDLRSVVEDWLDGVPITWEFEGVTLEKICELEMVSMADAFIQMAAMMQEPELAQRYAKKTESYWNGPIN